MTSTQRLLKARPLSPKGSGEGRQTMVCASSWADTRAMPTITKTKPTRKSVVPSAENPWEAVARVLEQLDEGQRAVLVVQVGAADPTPNEASTPPVRKCV